jgi:hypothetical protein
MGKLPTGPPPHWPAGALAKQDDRTLFFRFQTARKPTKGPRFKSNKKAASVSLAALNGRKDRLKAHPAFGSAFANRAFLTR